LRADAIRFRLRLPIRLLYSDLLRDYPHLRRSAKVPYRLHAAVKLSTLGSDLRIPFSHKGETPIFQPPTITVAKVYLADVSLSRARLIVDAEIENPNVFELGVESLAYELELGEILIEVHGAPSGGTTIGAGRSERATLSGAITPSQGLIMLLMNGHLGHSEHIGAWSPPDSLWNCLNSAISMSYTAQSPNCQFDFSKPDDFSRRGCGVH